MHSVCWLTVLSLAQYIQNESWSIFMSFPHYMHGEYYIIGVCLFPEPMHNECLVPGLSLTQYIHNECGLTVLSYAQYSRNEYWVIGTIQLEYRQHEC